MEVIKQGIRAPLPTVNQVVLIYAGVNGYLDDIPVPSVLKFEKELYEALDSFYTDFVKLFNKEQSLTDEVKAALKKLLTEFKQKFKV